MVVTLSIIAPLKAHAAGGTSIYCPTLNASVVRGGSVMIDVTNCDGPWNIGVGGYDPNDLAPQHGSYIIGLQSGPGTQFVTYTHNGDSATSDAFQIEDQNEDRITINITITPPTSSIAIAPTTLPTLKTGASFNQTLTSTGGVGPYTYSVSGGALTAGLSLSPSGVISGIPSERALYSFIIRSTDSTNAYTDKGYSDFMQNPTLILDTPTGTAGQGVAFSQTLSTSGGIAPYTYQMETGSLPAGLAFPRQVLLAAQQAPHLVHIL
ncbi:MAG: Ig domain-containing protein [Proteobacteria bacterium]|nr:Ig domain-containing protein [Pseudomonadota bacterium]